MNETVADRPVPPAPVLPPLAPLGVPLAVELERALDPADLLPAFAGWEGEGEPGIPAARLRIGCDARHSGTAGAAVTVRGTTVEIAGPGVLAQADPIAGLANCRVSRDYIAAPDRLREDVLDPLVLTLLARRDRTPLHASGFLVDGLAILLAGRSGAGKSCLARAADSAGFQLLTDDVVYVEQAERLRVWGWPRAIHLLPEDAGPVGGPSRLRNGRVKRVLAAQSASAGTVCAARAVLCVLARGDCVGLSPLGPVAVLERLFPLDPGFDLLPVETCAALGALTRRGAWELTLSRNPAEAVALLAANCARLAETAAA